MFCPKISLVNILVVSGLLLAQVATASDDKGQYGVRGAALVSCSIYEKEREARSPVYRMVASWMDGYITARNQYESDTYDTASFESTELLAALVSEHCKKHPETLVFTVVNSLVTQFAKNRLRLPSKKIEIMIGDRKVLLYEEVVRRMLEKLSVGGFYDGKINSVYGPQAQTAMQAFQKSIELQPTGFPDQLTLWRLFNENQASGQSSN